MGRHDAAQLLKRMLAHGVPQCHLDPLMAISEAKDANLRDIRRPLIAFFSAYLTSEFENIRMGGGFVGFGLFAMVAQIGVSKMRNVERWLICIVLALFISAPAHADELSPQQKWIIGDIAAANTAVKICGSKLNLDAINAALRSVGLALTDDRVRLYLEQSTKEYHANIAGISRETF